MDDFKNMVALTGRTALVVGGGGIGAPIAAALAQNGADVIVAGRRRDNLGELEDLCDAEGRKFFFEPVDLLDESTITRMVASAEKRTGRIDILVNAAGINIFHPAEDYDTPTWDKVLGVNLRGLHITTREVGKIMIRRQYGRIISISSVKSFIGTDSNYSAYCASKAAVNMYSKQLACEWGRHGITVNVIAPTFTRTPINAFQLDNPEFFNALIQRIPMGRICSSRDLGCASVFLASDAAAFITGQVIAVDGGLTAKQ